MMLATSGIACVQHPSDHTPNSHASTPFAYGNYDALTADHPFAERPDSPPSLFAQDEFTDLEVDESRNPLDESIVLAVEILEHPTNEELDLLITVENTGDTDTYLNPGWLLRNGKTQMPSGIALRTIAPSGKWRDFGYSDPRIRRLGGIGGRIDDYMIPLKSRCSHVFRLSFDDFWGGERPERKPLSIEPGPDIHRLQAFLRTSKVSALNNDTEGLGTFPVMAGVARSKLIPLVRPWKQKP